MCFRQLLRLFPARSHCPPWHADRRSAQGWRSQTEGESRRRTEESLLSSGRFRLSPATGAHNTAAFQFNSTFLLRRTQVLCFFLDSRKKRNPFVPLRPPPLVPRPLLGTAAGIGKTVETFLCIYAVLYCEKVTLYPHFRDNLRGKVVDNLDNEVGITFTIHSGFPPLK